MFEHLERHTKVVTTLLWS